MTRQDPTQPTCNINLDPLGHQECGNLAVAYETIEAETFEMDVIVCEEHIDLIDDHEYIEEAEP